MSYAFLLSVATALLAVRCLLGDEHTILAKTLVMATLFAGLLLPLFRPGLAMPAIVPQAGLAVFLVIEAKYRGR